MHREYEWVIQGDYGYGQGWEDLCAYDNKSEAGDDLLAYREAEQDINVRHRLIRREVSA